ncbi:MAG: hypothetical protein WCJ04_08460 [Actinomycetes bacterium]
MAKQSKAKTARKMLMGLALLVLVVAICVEIGGRVVTQRIAEDQLRSAGVAGGVEVTVGESWWRPTVLPAIFTGQVDRIAIRLNKAKLYSLPVTQADYILNDLQIDLSLRTAKVVASSLGSGSVRVLIDPSEIGALVGVPAEIRDGALLLGSPLEPAQLSLQGQNLVIDSPQLRSAGQVTSLQIADPELLPCNPQVRILGAMVELACTGNSLPGVLRNSIGVGTPSIPVDSQPTQLEPPVTLDKPRASPITTPAGGNDGG